MTPAYVYRATLRRVVDGDTYEPDIGARLAVWTIFLTRYTLNISTAGGGL